MIRLTSEIRDSLVMGRVMDEGAGIPEDELQHQFGKFYRAKNATNMFERATDHGRFPHSRLSDVVPYNQQFPD